MTNLKIQFGKRVKAFRQKNKLSQEELAEKVGIAITNMGKIERGENFVTAATLVKLAEVLNVEIRDLFDFGNHKSAQDMRDEITEFMKDDFNVGLVYKIYKLLTE